MNLPRILWKLYINREVRGMERLARRVDPNATRPVVFYGSSSIRLWTTLGADLGDPTLVNLGFGGSTLADCSRFFGRLVVPRNPRAILVYAGDNDLGMGRSVADVVASFGELRANVDAHFGSIPFAFLSIKPSPARWGLIDAIREANSAIREELESRPNAAYIDIVDAMLGPNGRPRPELYADDGLHLSGAGYRVWTAEVLKFRGFLDLQTNSTQIP